MESPFCRGKASWVASRPFGSVWVDSWRHSMPVAPSLTILFLSALRATQLPLDDHGVGPVAIPVFTRIRGAHRGPGVQGHVEAPGLEALCGRYGANQIPRQFVERRRDFALHFRRPLVPHMAVGTDRTDVRRLRPVNSAPQFPVHGSADLVTGIAVSPGIGEIRCHIEAAPEGDPGGKAGASTPLSVAASATATPPRHAGSDCLVFLRLPKKPCVDPAQLRAASSVTTGRRLVR